MINSKKEHFLGSLFWVGGGRVFRLLLSISVFFYSAKFYGPAGFGLLSIAIGLQAILLSFTSLGIEKSLVRDVANSEPQTHYATISLAIVLRSLASWVAFTGLCMYVGSNYSVSDIAVIIVITSTGLYSPLSVVDSVGEATRSFKSVALAQSISAIVSALLKIAALKMNSGLLVFAIIVHAEALGYYLLSILFLRHRIQGRFVMPSLKSLFGYIGEGLPLLVSAVSVGLYMRLDQFMLQHYIDTRSVGIYSMAVRFVEIWYLIPVSFSAVLFPYLARLRKAEPSQYFEALNSITRISVALSLLMAAVLGLSASLIPYLLGDIYKESVPVIWIYSINLSFVFLGMLRVNHFVLEKMSYITMWATGIGLVANVTLNLLLIPFLGILGAAVSTTISQAIVGCGTTFLFSRSRPYGFIQLNSIIPFRTIRNIRSDIAVTKALLFSKHAVE